MHIVYLTSLLNILLYWCLHYQNYLTFYLLMDSKLFRFWHYQHCFHRNAEKLSLYAHLWSFSLDFTLFFCLSSIFLNSLLSYWPSAPWSLFLRYCLHLPNYLPLSSLPGPASPQHPSISGFWFLIPPLHATETFVSKVMSNFWLFKSSLYFHSISQ